MILEAQGQLSLPLAIEESFAWLVASMLRGLPRSA